ncbi:NAD(P)/FAD-dependent oxidoreductase [Streptomyces sodiiphilus]|uniref:NAD(P)/FAD-dependent oxidoreductase n=1 Tax=Streptomyces sodiiphilus TaxID=226217 RepID=A0ABP5AS09_9ACTN
MARIVVVGAGMGGMAGAARLAVAGHRVTVLERGPVHGGAVRRLERDGFGFDTGPGLLHLPAVWRDLFLKTGREPLEECVRLTEVDPAAEHRFPDGTVTRVPGFSRGGLRQALDASLGKGAGERWAALLVRARQTWEETRRPLMEEPLTPRARDEASSRDPYPAAPRRGLPGRRGPGGLAGVARRELRDPRLTAMLAGTLPAWGLDPRTAPASAAVLPYIEETFGTWYPAGGMRALADAVHARCLARGVEFVFGAEAVRVLQRDGRAAGVELADGTRHEADAVVWGAARPGDRPAAGSRVTVLLALRGPRPPGTAHRTLVHPARPLGDPLEHPVVLCLRPGDPALVPGPDHESAVLSAAVPAGGPADPVAFADRLLATADAAGLGLGPRVLWREIRTPRDVEQDTGAPGGLIPGPALAGAGGAFLPASTAGRLPGTYRVGGWSHPGGGVAHGGMSGALAAGLIVEGPDWQGSY